MAGRTASDLRPRLLQVPAVRVDRRERRLLREPTEKELEPGCNGGITRMARLRHSLGRRENLRHRK